MRPESSLWFGCEVTRLPSKHQLTQLGWYEFQLGNHQSASKTKRRRDTSHAIWERDDVSIFQVAQGPLFSDPSNGPTSLLHLTRKLRRRTRRTFSGVPQSVLVVVRGRCGGGGGCAPPEGRRGQHMRPRVRGSVEPGRRYRGHGGGRGARQVGRRVHGQLEAGQQGQREYEAHSCLVTASRLSSD